MAAKGEEGSPRPEISCVWMILRGHHFSSFFFFSFFYVAGPISSPFFATRMSCAHSTSRKAEGENGLLPSSLFTFFP